MIALDDPNVRRVLDRLHRAERGDWLFFARHPQIVTRILFGKEAGQPGAALSAELKDVYIPMSVLRDKR